MIVDFDLIWLLEQAQKAFALNLLKKSTGMRIFMDIWGLVAVIYEFRSIIKNWLKSDRTNI